MPLDPALVGALHIEYLDKAERGSGDHLHHSLFQTSTIEALLGGNYDGDVTFAELEDRGDFGLGTLDALDGEMVALGGDFYQVRADGRAHAIDGRARTPFAVVTFFEPGPAHEISAPTDFDGLCALIDRLAGEARGCCAVRVDGYFDRVKTRSVPRQRRPYPPLVEVVQAQPTFELRDVAGSLVGFRFPDHARGLNVAGYHFHFITDDRGAGGHVLACRIVRGEVLIDHEADLRLELPPGVDLPDPSVEQGDELDRVERDPAGH